MKELTPQKKKKLLEAIQEGKIADEKSLALYQILDDAVDKVERMEEIQKEIEAKIETVKQDLTPTKEELLTLIEPLIPEIPKVVKGEKGEPGTPGKDGVSIKGADGLTPNLADLVLEASTKVQEAIEPTIPTIEAIEKDIPKLGEPIRDSLELLKDENRLDISAIKGTDKKELALTDSIINRAIGIVDQRTSFLVQKVSNLSEKVDTRIDLGTVTSVLGTTNRITSTGGTTPVIDISATFEALLGKVANPLSQFAATTSLQLKNTISDETGSGALVFADTPTLIAPLLGTPTSGVLTNLTGLPISTGISGLGTGIATFLTTPSSANLLVAVTDETGTGVLVFGTAPTFTTQITTPSIITASGALGITPAAGSNLNINLSTTGDFAVNTNQLYVDTSTGNVGIGTTGPSQKLEIVSAGASTLTGLMLKNYSSTNGYASTLYFYKSKSDTVALAATIDGTFLASLDFRGVDSGNSSFRQAAEIQVIQDGAAGATWVPGRFQFVVTKASDGSQVNAMAIKNDGNVGIGTTEPTNILSLGGNAARIFWLERHTTAGTAGNTLTITAGGATAAATDKNGGDLLLQGGLSTGTGESGVQMYGCVAGATGTADRTQTLGIQLLGNKLGFYGVTPVTRQTELTDELTTVTFTAPGTPDYAVQDLVQNTGFGFVTKDEGNTVLSVIANLQARVNELETKLTAYGLLIDVD